MQQTVSTQVAILDEVKRFELFRSVIEHEDDILNQRVSWIILNTSTIISRGCLHYHLIDGCHETNHGYHWTVNCDNHNASYPSSVEEY